ncbi:bifunctional pyr operon transcriptional regulator/uracil phosphoribosyltransferase PyrR [bacterium]
MKAAYTEKEIIIDKIELNRTLKRMAYEIIENTRGVKNLVLIGLETRGVFIAKRILDEIKKVENEEIPMGTLDISLYRDDVHDPTKSIKIKPTDFPFSVDGKNIVLIDDVLFTGRSVRAAIECIMDFGRPTTIRLGVLIDRGYRELPIQADFIGKKFGTIKNELISVELKEIDDKDRVVLLESKK